MWWCILLSPIELISDIVEGIGQDSRKNPERLPDKLRIQFPKDGEVFRPAAGFPGVITNFDLQSEHITGSRREQLSTGESNIWASARIIAEPNIRTFNSLMREFTVVVIYMQVPEDRYPALEVFDKEIFRRLRATGRLINSTRVTDLLGIATSSPSRERTVIIR